MSTTRHSSVPSLPPGTTPTIPSKLDDAGYPSISAFGSQAASASSSTVSSMWTKLSSTISNVTTPVLNALSSGMSNLLDIVSVYWRSYPSLRAFTYVFGVLTAIPTAIFMGYAAISLTIVGGMALAGVALVEGAALGFGMLFFGPVLFFSFWGSVIAVGLFTALLYGLRATSITLGTTQETLGLRTGMVGSTLNVAKNAAATTADIVGKTESLVVGPSGMPVPISGRV